MVSKEKIDSVEELTVLLDKYPVVGILEMKSMPSAQLQEMRKQLSDKAIIRMYRKNVIIRALDKSKKKGIKDLKEQIGEIPALIFSDIEPFKLSSILKKNKSPAAAKIGDVLQKEVEVKAGPTNIMAGPAIGQLQKLGLKTSVVDGKIKIESPRVIAKPGDVVTKDLVNVFTLIGVKPMDISLKMLAAYEDGMIYGKEALDIDQDYVLKSLNEAVADAFNLSIALKIPTKENISYLLASAARDAEALSVEKKEEPKKKEDEKTVENTTTGEETKEEEK